MNNQDKNINPSKIDSIFTNQMVLERNIPSLQSGEAVCHPRATGGGIQLQPCHTSSMARVFDNDENRRLVNHGILDLGGVNYTPKSLRNG